MAIDPGLGQLVVRRAALRLFGGNVAHGRRVGGGQAKSNSAIPSTGRVM